MMAYILDDLLPDIRPCPFCGRDPAVQKDIRFPRPKCNAMTAYEVVCKTIGCPIYNADNTYFSSPIEAIQSWNRRPSHDREGISEACAKR